MNLKRTVPLSLVVAAGALLVLLLLGCGSDAGSDETHGQQASDPVTTEEPAPEEVTAIQDPITIEDASGVFRYDHLELDPRMEQASGSARISILATAAPALFGQPFGRSAPLEVVLSALPPVINVEHGVASLADGLMHSPELSRSAAGVFAPLLVEHSAGLLGGPLMRAAYFFEEREALAPSILIEHVSGLWWTGLKPPAVEE